VRARPDRRQHLLRLRGGEDEDEVVRWLLDDLEQGVEALRGDHVRLVDDEHAVPRLGRCIEGAVAQLTGVVDTTVRRRVQLDDVDVARPLRRQRDARRTHPARVRGRSLYAVQRAGEDAGRRRLAAAAGPGEQVRVVDPSGFERDPQRLGDVLLADDVGESRRTVLPVQSQRHAARLPTARPAVGGTRKKESGPTHPPEPVDPCCLPALGEFTGCAPRGPVAKCSRSPRRATGRLGFEAEDSPSGLWRTLGKRVGFTPSRVRIPHPPLVEQHRRRAVPTGARPASASHLICRPRRAHHRGSAHGARLPFPVPRPRPMPLGELLPRPEARGTPAY
jgi:hypothetical protein